MVQLNTITNSNVGGIIAIIGTSFTLMASLLIWLKPVKVHSTEFSAVLLGILASTAAVTWHSHVHMILVLFPPLAYLAVQTRVPAKIIYFWSFGPPIILVLSYSCQLLVNLGFIPEFGFEGFFFGLWGFIFNLSILALVIKFRNQPNADAI